MKVNPMNMGYGNPQIETNPQIWENVMGYGPPCRPGQRGPVSYAGVGTPCMWFTRHHSFRTGPTISRYPLPPVRGGRPVLPSHIRSFSSDIIDFRQGDSWGAITGRHRRPCGPPFFEIPTSIGLPCLLSLTFLIHLSTDSERIPLSLTLITCTNAIAGVVGSWLPRPLAVEIARF